MKLIIDNVSLKQNSSLSYNIDFTELILDSQDKLIDIAQKPLLKEIDEIFINVNLKAEGLSRQHNCGVMLYRELVRSKMIVPGRHKICFYSFLTKEQCVKLSKGRDVLLLFKEFYAFERLPDLFTKLSEDISVFNSNTYPLQSGPEILLAGWGMKTFQNDNKIFTQENYLANKICIENKFLLIDDKAKHWKPVLKIVLSDSIKEIDASSERIKPNVLNLKKVANIDNNILGPILGVDNDTAPFDFIHKHDAILLDLFLNPDGSETHDSQSRLTDEKIKSISGYKMLKLIHNIHPGIPVMMFTKSTKVWNYKSLSSIGVDEWWAKPGSSIKISDDTIRDYCLDFEDSITKVTQMPYPELKVLTKSVHQLKKILLNLKNGANLELSPIFKSRNEIIKLFDQSLFTLKFSQKYEKEHDYYIYSSIVEQLGNINELVDCSHYNRYKNKYFAFAKYLRNIASHSDEYAYISIFDVLLMFNLLIIGIKKFLDEGNQEFEDNSLRIEEIDALGYHELLDKKLLLTYLNAFTEFSKNNTITLLIKNKLRSEPILSMFNTFNGNEIQNCLKDYLSITNRDVYESRVRQKIDNRSLRLKQTWVYSILKTKINL